MRKTTKKFLSYERFERGTVLRYTDANGETQEHTFYIGEEDTRQFFKADSDSRDYFQKKLAESMREYQVILLGLVEILNIDYIDGGWDEEATSIARDYCWDMEGRWHNVECYQMILEELKKKL